jgi:hypothetical protein
MSPPGRDVTSGPPSRPGRPHHPESPLRSQEGSDDRNGINRRRQEPGSDWDADLAVIRDSAESIPVWLAIWSARGEPDAHARRCASDAIDSADRALAALHRIRARLVGQAREADDATADRVDALLARLREEPP